MLVKYLKQTHDLTGHNEWSQAMGNSDTSFKGGLTLALGAETPPFFGCTGPQVLSWRLQQAGATLCCGTWALGPRASIAAPSACEILLDQGTSDPCHWQADSLTLGPPAKSLEILVFKTERHTANFTLGHTTYPASGCRLCAGSGHTPQVFRGTAHPFNCPSHAMILHPLCIPVTLCPAKAFLNHGQNHRILHMSQDPRKVKGNPSLVMDILFSQTL